MIRLFKAGSIKLPATDCDRDFIKYNQKKSEEILYVLHPSMARFLGSIIFCILTFWLIFPIIIYIFIYYHNKATKYIITNERIRVI